MIELVANLHIHTRYSDGSKTHREIAEIGHDAGLDVLIFTDHNVLVRGVEGYVEQDGHRLLILVGEEIHDPARNPQKSHLLAVGQNRELATYAKKPQNLLNQANKNGAVTFIAHPFESDLPAFGETDITWEDWQVEGYTGIEIWNGLSELKDVVHNHLDGLFYAFFPQHVPNKPSMQTLKKWDELLAGKNKVVAIGGSDAHALHFRLGFLKRIIFPYRYHFETINTHILVPHPLNGDLTTDRKMVIEALRSGNCFVANDLPAPANGFRFVAQGKEKTAHMGESIALASGLTLQIRLPMRTRCTLIKDGIRQKTWEDQEILTQFINQPGTYRIEVEIHYLSKWRGWIYSNPIYVFPN